MTQKAWIVWNDSRTEGVVFTDRVDAMMTSQGYEAMQDMMQHGPISSLGEAFTDLYEPSRDHFLIEEITTAVESIDDA